MLEQLTIAGLRWNRVASNLRFGRPDCLKAQAEEYGYNDPTINCSGSIRIRCEEPCGDQLIFERYIRQLLGEIGL